MEWREERIIYYTMIFEEWKMKQMLKPFVFLSFICGSCFLNLIMACRPTDFHTQWLSAAYSITVLV